jgi:hypothetical protein
MSDASSKIVSDALAGQIIQKATVYLNLSQDYIVITEDKVKLCLIEHLSRMESRKSWIAPLGIVLTLLITFATTTFRDYAGLKAAAWQAIFIVATVLSVAWLLLTVKNALKSPSVEDVVTVMKRAGENQTQDLPNP